MLDARGTTTTATTWQDNHSGYRRHKLMTKELGDTIPAIGANENVDDYDAVLAPAKLFSPLHRLALVYHGVGTPRPGCASASSRGSRPSWATSISPSWRRRPCSVASPPWERDLYWKPQTLGEIRRQSRGRMAA